jgi:hypothetical protein
VTVSALEVQVAIKPHATHRAAKRDVVLIVAHTTTFLTELAPFGKLIRERAGAETIFYCPFIHWTANSFAAACKRDGVTCLLAPVRESLAREGLRPTAAPPAIVSIGQRIHMLAARALGRLAARLPGIGQSFLAESLAFSALTSEILALLSAVEPKLIVLGGDMVGYDSSLYVKLGHERGIPTLIVPSTMSNGLEQAEVYYVDPAYHVTGWAGELVARLFPKWVRKHRDRRLFRCPPGRIIAMELARLAPPQPWIFNSGAADAIAMESPAMIDYYVEAGMENERMILTGSLSDEAMAARLPQAQLLRDRLCGELGFDPTRPLVVTALPPDFLYVDGGRPQCDFRRYKDLVAFWIGSFADLSACNSIVALHPSVDIETMRHIESDNVRIGTWKTAEMIPACDIYVASISSTIRWAIACGRPVVNYDVYRYRYTDFLSVPGVLATEEQDEFRRLLRRLVEDIGYRKEVADRQAALSSHWGMLDGRVGDRMLDLVQQLCGIGRGEPLTPPAAPFAAPEAHKVAQPPLDGPLTHQQIAAAELTRQRF